jgi:predicted phosphohydrolase
MSVFTIADLHLSLNASTNKSMDVFGRRWQGYTEKLEKNWRAEFVSTYSMEGC